MNILLTGGSGFIGKNINESFLAKKHNIFSPSRAQLDLTNSEQVYFFFKNTSIDVVIHCAGKPSHRNAKDPSQILNTNYMMFANLLQNSEQFKKLILIGSGACYDMLHYKPKMKEEYFGAYIPVDEHGFHRYACGKLSENNKKIVDLRVFGIFGKHEDYAIRFISNAICKTLFDLPITIKQNRKFDYLYIDDLMPILDYFIKNQSQFNAYNVTPDKSIELYSLAEKILKISGKKLPIVVRDKGMGVEYSGDNVRLKKEIKDLSFTSIDESIKKLYGWYKKNKLLINKSFLLTDK